MKDDDNVIKGAFENAEPDKPSLREVVAAELAGVGPLENHVADIDHGAGDDAPGLGRADQNRAVDRHHLARGFEPAQSRAANAQGRQQDLLIGHRMLAHDQRGRGRQDRQLRCWSDVLETV